uniref:Uncharacterized protein n=1 Tax=Arundo donax TaxID=35708 RepID=A0A0A9CCZ7_ARUDO
MLMPRKKYYIRSKIFDIVDFSILTLTIHLVKKTMQILFILL